MKTAITLPHSSLVEFLKSINHATPIAFSARTRVDVAAACPHSAVFKVSRVGGMIAYDYEKAVNRQQVREGAETGSFESKPRKWGKHVSPAVIFHENKAGERKHYLSVKVQHARKPFYLAPGAGGFLVPVPDSTVKPYLRKTDNPGTAQGVVSAIIHRDYDIANLYSANLCGLQIRQRETPSEQPNTGKPRRGYVPRGISDADVQAHVREVLQRVMVQMGFGFQP